MTEPVLGRLHTRRCRTKPKFRISPTSFSLSQAPNTLQAPSKPQDTSEACGTKLGRNETQPQPTERACAKFTNHVPTHTLGSGASGPWNGCCM